jgi:hypothetical protein
MPEGVKDRTASDPRETISPITSFIRGFDCLVLGVRHFRNKKQNMALCLDICVGSGRVRVGTLVCFLSPTALMGSESSD